MNDNPVQPQPKVDRPLDENTNVMPVEPQAAPSMKPEHEPLGSFVKYSEAEPILPSEVLEQGVEVVNQHVPNLSQEVKDAGVAHAKETVPPSLNPSPALSMLPDEIKEAKEGSKNDSKTWFASLLDKVVKAFGVSKQTSQEGGSS